MKGGLDGLVLPAFAWPRAVPVEPLEERARLVGGGRGFRTGVDARGRRTTQASIPSTGVGYRKVGARGSRGCLFAVGAVALLALGAVGVSVAVGVIA